MPQLLAQHHDSRFLATLVIKNMEMLPDGKHLLCYSSDYSSHYLEVFYMETGERVAQQAINYKDYGFKFLLNAATNNYYFWGTEGEWTEEKTYYIQEISFADGVLSVVKTGANFTTKAYFPHIAVTKERICIVTDSVFTVLNAETKEIAEQHKGINKTDPNNGAFVTADTRYGLFGEWHSQHIKVFDSETEKTLHTLKTESIRDDFGMHYLEIPNTRNIIVGGKQNIAIWDILKNKKILQFRVQNVYDASIIDMKLSPDGKYLVVFYAGLVMAMYTVENGEQIWGKQDMEGTITFAFTSNSQTLYISKAKTIAKLDVKTGFQTNLTEAFNAENIGKMYWIPLENRILGFMGMKAVHLNAKTGVVEDVIASNRSPVFAYNPNEVDSPKNFAMSGWYGTSMGSASVETSKSRIKPIFSNFYGNIAVSGEFIVACHTYRSNASKKQLMVYDLNGKNGVLLAQSDKNIPIHHIEFLNNSGLLAGVGEKFVCVWDIENKTQIWQTPLKKDYNPQLFTHENGTHILVKTSREILMCFDSANGNLLWEYAPRKEKPKDKKDKSYQILEFKAVFARNNQVVCLMQNGDLRNLDLTTGAVLATQNISSSGSMGAAIAPNNSLYILNKDMSFAQYDAKDWLGEINQTGVVFDKNSIQKSENKPKNPFIFPNGNATNAEMLAHFAAADWSDFNWENFEENGDIKTLIQVLNEKEKSDSSNELHHFCLAKLFEADKNNRVKNIKLTHRYGHLGDMVAFGVSPDGQYLATGSWVGEDYDAGGELMIWEVATGHCVHKMEHVNGGIGWPDYGGCLQWSPDSRTLGIVVNTNGVAVINPFEDGYNELHEFYETDGWSRPPQWCWQPEGKAVFIACWMRDAKLPGCVAPLNNTDFPLAQPYGFNADFDKNYLQKLKYKKATINIMRKQYRL